MKILKYLIVTLIIFGILFATAYFIKTNSKSITEYKTETPFISSVEQKTVVTGKVIPEDEVEIKPQISGIIQELFVEEGENVKEGDLLAKVKVVPNEGSLNSAKGRVASLKIILDNAKIEFDRNKLLYEKEIISKQDFQNASLNFDRASQDLANAKSDLEVILLGSAGGSSTANTNIRATVAGTVLEIPVEAGDQVVESNTFNAGTTIATIADLNKMIFEGKIDESEVEKLKIEMPLVINLGAIQNKDFDAKLKFIAPKGNEEQGTVKFKIEADVFLDNSINVRAGYSANASLVLEKKDSVMVISEALLQFDKSDEEAFVEIEKSDQKFKRIKIETGISDGINIEILSGLTMDDKIKVWNETKPEKIGDDDEDDYEK
ncbi:MAG: efflux transporter periplasmic adaptor subunit [Flavobacteriales bacterium]|nr:efflux transporter periplasmic adaptor subunit [Flavobacteriales bacterium]